MLVRSRQATAPAARRYGELLSFRFHLQRRVSPILLVALARCSQRRAHL